MDFRIDTPFKISGTFGVVPDDTAAVDGEIHYIPESGLKLKLSTSPWPWDIRTMMQSNVPESSTLFGRLLDNTLVTLYRCIVTNFSRGFNFVDGIRRSSMTIYVNYAIFGCHLTDIESLEIKKYSIELSSLASWMGKLPSQGDAITESDQHTDFDLENECTSTIEVALPTRDFDVCISDKSTEVALNAEISIVANNSLSFETAQNAAWQCRNLLSLLVGDPLSIKSVEIAPASQDSEHSLKYICEQAGQHDREDIFFHFMPLPYEKVKDNFPAMMNNWFDRSEQATLATNLFFGIHGSSPDSVDVKFLAAAQIVESYHRSLGSHFYMEQEEYDKAIEDFLGHIPTCIKGDHRVSLRNRLKFGNEYSLRKRLNELLRKIPEDVRNSIAGDCGKFVNRTVNTRNYYTHYAHDSKHDIFIGKEAYVAAERLRILAVANLLHDLGISEEELLSTLKRQKEFNHWLKTELPL